MRARGGQWQTGLGRPMTKPPDNEAPPPMTSTPTVWTRNRKATSSKLEPRTKPSTTTTTEWNRTASGNPRASIDRKAGLLARLGPGLITGASDDDPSGIATYSQAGSRFGFGLLWTILFSYPLMGGI